MNDSLDLQLCVRPKMGGGSMVSTQLTGLPTDEGKTRQKRYLFALHKDALPLPRSMHLRVRPKMGGWIHGIDTANWVADR